MTNKACNDSYILDGESPWTQIHCFDRGCIVSGSYLNILFIYILKGVKKSSFRNRIMFLLT